MPRLTGVDKSGKTIGEIIQIGRSALPTGILPCDGSAVSRTTYASLFSIVGTAFGVGDGSTTFNVPDLRGRAPIGDGTGAGLSARTIGQIPGEEVHTLTAAESGVPAHNHGVTDPGHTHSLSNSVSANTGNTNDNTANVTAVNRYGLISNVSANNNTSGISVNNSSAAAASTSHNNMQPSLVVKYGIVYL